jgi:hypothetical protein
MNVGASRNRLHTEINAIPSGFNIRLIIAYVCLRRVAKLIVYSTKETQRKAVTLL